MFEFRKEGGPFELFGFYCPTSKNQVTFDFLVYDPKDKHGYLDRSVEKITYIAITSDSPATIDLPFSTRLNEIVTCKYQLLLR